MSFEEPTEAEKRRRDGIKTTMRDIAWEKIFSEQSLSDKRDQDGIAQALSRALARESNQCDANLKPKIESGLNTAKNSIEEALRLCKGGISKVRYLVNEMSKLPFLVFSVLDGFLRYATVVKPDIFSQFGQGSNYNPEYFELNANGELDLKQSAIGQFIQRYKNAQITTVLPKSQGCFAREVVCTIEGKRKNLVTAMLDF